LKKVVRLFFSESKIKLIKTSTALIIILRRDDMITALFITVLAITLLPGVSSFAVSHGGVDAGDNLQPTITSDVIIVPLEFADKENLEILLQNLNDPDPFVRVEAIQALGEIQEKQSLVAVSGCFNDENIYVRAYAAEALGKIGTIDVFLTLSKLLPALDDPSPYVRAMMAATLGELQDARAIAPLREMLQDKDETVRGMAAWALGNIENSQ
jgi:HEAT repeat protein